MPRTDTVWGGWGKTGAWAAAGRPVFAAAGDTGSQDSGGDGLDHVDYPASDPNVFGVGGTRLTVNADGSRASEVVWNDNDRTSATGGGISAVFTSRQVPDFAGNADPVTGYLVRVAGREDAIGEPEPAPAVDRA